MREPVRMPFGKFKGRALGDLPEDYLAWLFTIDLKPPLLEAITRERDRRRHETVSATSSFAIDPEAKAAALEILKHGFRHVAKTDHPDHGGTGAKMRAALRARDALARLLS